MNAIRCYFANYNCNYIQSDNIITNPLADSLYNSYRTGGYYHHVSKKNATAPPNVVNTSDTQYLSLETCIIIILTRW